jgi:hypothetical protein
MIHRIFRRESRLLVDFVGEVAPGDTARAGVLAGVWTTYADAVHAHHRAEDDLVWPVVRERAEQDAAPVAPMEHQHEELAATITEVQDLFDAWAPTADEAGRDRLTAALAAHRTVLLAHLDDEEASAMPLVERYLTAEEWKAVGERGLAETPRNRLMIALGAILEEATPQEQAVFLGRLPGVARLLWRLVGVRQYRKEIRRVRGDRTVAPTEEPAPAAVDTSAAAAEEGRS